MPIPEALIEEILNGNVASVSGKGDRLTALLPPASVLDALEALRDHIRTRFSMLVDLTAVDYLHFHQKQPERFAVVYQLYSFDCDQRIRIKAFLPEDQPKIDSVSDLWCNAQWLEREVYDMYGIVFNGHPALSRILMPDDFRYYPLRKDYPLKGKGERMQFPRLPGSRWPKTEWKGPPRAEYERSIDR